MNSKRSLTRNRMRNIHFRHVGLHSASVVACQTLRNIDHNNCNVPSEVQQENKIFFANLSHIYKMR